MQVQRHALALVRLEPLKLMSGVGKGLCGCKLRFEHGRTFIGWALLFALLPTHKNIIRSSSPRCKAVKEKKGLCLARLFIFLGLAMKANGGVSFSRPISIAAPSGLFFI
jgi:hypothetical protein